MASSLRGLFVPAATRTEVRVAGLRRYLTIAAVSVLVVGEVSKSRAEGGTNHNFGTLGYVIIGIFNVSYLISLMV